MINIQQQQHLLSVSNQCFFSLPPWLQRWMTMVIIHHLREHNQICISWGRPELPKQIKRVLTPPPLFWRTTDNLFCLYCHLFMVKCSLDKNENLQHRSDLFPSSSVSEMVVLLMWTTDPSSKTLEHIFLGFKIFTKYGNTNCLGFLAQVTFVECVELFTSKPSSESLPKS